MLKRKLIALKPYIKREEKTQINSLSFQYMEKRVQDTPNTSRRKEIKKLEWKLMKQKRTTKTWLFEKVNKIDKTLTSWPREREETEITEIKN